MEHVDPHVDFVTSFTDGSYVTYSTTTIAEGTERPPTMPIERFAGSSPIEVLEKLLKERPDKLRNTVSPEGFVPCIEGYVAKEAAWRQSQYERDEQRRQELEEAFLEQSGWSAIQWDRNQERVIFIHDELRPDEVADAYTECLEELEEDACRREEHRAKRVAKSKPARQAFAELVGLAPESVVFEKLAELTNPVPVDVYMAPEAE